ILYLAGAPDAERIAPIRTKLYEARARRVHPLRDDKVLASWNGLACRAFAEAGRALGRPDYVAAAVKNAAFVLEAMRTDGRLLRRQGLTGESRYEASGAKALRPMADLRARHASGCGRCLCALDFHLGPVVEIALVASAAGDGLGPLVSEVFGRYMPNRVVAGM